GRYGDANLAGIDHYNKLIDALLLKVTEPFVTLSHFDIPQELEDRYGAWLSPESQYLFQVLRGQGEVLGHLQRAKYSHHEWIPLSCIPTISNSQCTSPFGNCINGDSEKEPFVAAHNVILSHALAVDLYRTKYQVQTQTLQNQSRYNVDGTACEVLVEMINMLFIEDIKDEYSHNHNSLYLIDKIQKEQGGRIGITLHALWYEPISDSSLDKLAAEQSFFMNWLVFNSPPILQSLDPLIYGQYPAETREILGSILPEFSSKDQERLKTELDFIGINHYTSFFHVQDCIFSVCEPLLGTEGFTRQTTLKNGIHIGESTGMLLRVYPQGMEKMVTYVKERYNNIPMFVTENGYCEKTNSSSTIEESLYDVKRVEYMAGYLDALSTAMRKGADVRGYFAWSLLENFEWLSGYTKRFGLHQTEYATLEQTPKLSAAWYKEFIETKMAVKSLMPEPVQMLLSSG
ncbi:hypothetical protein RJ640_005556, partial [Escallonia rubra]